jgi:hypothetical protein
LQEERGSIIASLLPSEIHVRITIELVGRATEINNPKEIDLSRRRNNRFLWAARHRNVAAACSAHTRKQAHSQGPCAELRCRGTAWRALLSLGLSDAFLLPGKYGTQRLQ